MIQGQLRVSVAVLGMLLAALGVILGNRPVVWAAIGVLTVAYILRFVAARPRRREEEDS